MPDGNPVTLMTVRVTLMCYAIVLTLLLAGCRGARWRRVLRTIWTIGCLAFVAHVAAAFHYTHHWSHADAIRSTAQQTKALMGWAFGEGLYFSYIFLLLWIADAAFWWLRPDRYESRPNWMNYAIHGYLFFIAFNGAIVFESGVTRPAGIVAVAVFAFFAYRRRNMLLSGSQRNDES